MLKQEYDLIFFIGHAKALLPHDLLVGERSGEGETFLAAHHLSPMDHGNNPRDSPYNAIIIYWKSVGTLFIACCLCRTRMMNTVTNDDICSCGNSDPDGENLYSTAESRKV
jgi:hypothetical protein